MTKVAEFNRLLTQRIKELIPVQTIWVVCKSVDWEKKHMTAVGQSDELEYEEILLGRGAMFKKPAIDSICLVGVIENNGANLFLIDAETIEEYLISDETGFEIRLNADGMTLNGEDFGGIVNAKELKTQVDKNTDAIRKIQQVFTAWVPVPNDGGGALKTASAAFVNEQLADLSNIENVKIKHG